MNFDPKQILADIDHHYSHDIEPVLKQYIRIPNKSPLFDPDWAQNGHMFKAAALLQGWCKRQSVQGLEIETLQLTGRTPVLFLTIPGSAPGNVLLYGHFDKQPEFTGWDEGLSPWEPVVKDGKLYGRGGADDGYAIFSSLLSILLLQKYKIPHATCHILIEGSEESGSIDLPFYVEHLGPKLGEPDLVVCLDAECANYDQFWLTTSLRGNLVGTLKVAVLSEGVHSGMATGIAPSAVRVLRHLLDRIENSLTGDITVESLYSPIPQNRVKEASQAASVLGGSVAGKLPFLEGVEAISDNPTELLLNSTWKPTLAVTGAAGLPALVSAGNVLLPEVALKLSLRLPPTLDADKAAIEIKQILEANPPYQAKVSFTVESSQAGWHAPELAPWLSAALQTGSRAFFGREAMMMGTGGSIPFIGMLGKRYPNTQFLVTGILGPHSNAHGPNEFLHLDAVRKLTGCVISVLAEQAKQAK
jgi:acetylornithine deacetylase/succinyl-diaminopimelate desuccinylase-like protein